MGDATNDFGKGCKAQRYEKTKGVGVGMYVKKGVNAKVELIF